jgi:glycosyltransferase 2 family protein
LITQLKRGYSFLVARPALRVALQALVSILLLVALVILAQRSNMLASLMMLQPWALLLAGSLQIIAFLINGRRWQILLEHFGIHERLATLTTLYFIGMFFSLFLPTGTGGDAVRMYDVARRSHRTAQAIVATLQERLAGLGTSLLVGLAAMIFYLPLVPAQLRIWIVLIQIFGAVCITLLIYPALMFAIFRRFWRRYGEHTLFSRLAAHPLVARFVSAIRPIAEAPPLPLFKLVQLLGIALTATLLGMGMYYTLGQSLQIPIGFMAYCLIVPMVWIIRMAPVSLNGLGLTEGAFVFLMGLFAIPQGQALALALAVLGIQTCCALIGGLLLALRIARGTWAGGRRAMPEPAAEALSEHG